MANNNSKTNLINKDKSVINKAYIFTLIKYIYPVLLALFSLRLSESLKFYISIVIETIILFFITNLIAKRNIVVSWIIGVVLLFFLYAQVIVLVFTGGYLKLIMLTNLDSLGALSGRIIVYGFPVIFSLLVLLFPITHIPININNRYLIPVTAGIIGVCITILGFIGRDYSSIYNTFSLFNIIIERRITENNIRRQMDVSMEDVLDGFYSDSVGDAVTMPDDLPQKPNIVLIFTEGLSKNIIEDSRNIMPNVSFYEKNGLSFNNYYNHTAATYRGIIGQLYSSHTFNNGDTNILVSLQSILKENGYETTFINSEPDNFDFTKYLSSFNFDNLTSSDKSDRSLTDGETYELLYNILEEGFNTGKPQLVSTYTFGTHVSFDSSEEIFGEGDNHLLNRFYNCDYQFGLFMDKLIDSGHGKDTIVVFTADHATFVDDEYTKTFSPGYNRFDSFCDMIPLIIWYDGINKEKIDADGRNSLDLAPTLLDYIDIDSGNYFLGSSLFSSEKKSEMETIFCVPDSDWRVNTDGGKLSALTEEETKKYMEVLEKYLSLTMKTDTPIP